MVGILNFAKSLSTRKVSSRRRRIYSLINHTLMRPFSLLLGSWIGKVANAKMTAFTDLGYSCDDVGLDGTPKDPSIPRGSYSHAQKLRAAATYGFGRLHGLGSLPWQRSEVSGKMIGNPSVSETVSRYMITLRKKKVFTGFLFGYVLLILVKVRAGEVATSACAITPVCFLPFLSTVFSS
jgi:hypothetical protein